MHWLTQNLAVLRTYICPGATGPYTVSGISKNGAAFAAPSDGAATDLGNGVVSVSWDTNDTDTLGDLAVEIKDGGVLKFYFSEDGVFNTPLAKEPNDGSGALKLALIQVINAGAKVIDIQGGAAGVPAIGVTSSGAAAELAGSEQGLKVTGGGGFYGIEIASDGGILINSTTLNGISVNATSSDGLIINAPLGVGVGIQSGNNVGVSIGGDIAGLSLGGSSGPAVDLNGSTMGLNITGAAQGVVINGAGGAGIAIGGATDGVEITGAAGQGMNVIGAVAGIACRSSATSLPTVLAAGFYAAANGIGARFRSTAAAGLAINGATVGAQITGSGGTSVTLNAVDLLLAIANTLLDLVDGVETSKTVRQTLRGLLSALCGKAFLTGSTRTFRDTNDTTDRITATTDNQGQRTSVTLNL